MHQIVLVINSIHPLAHVKLCERPRGACEFALAVQLLEIRGGTGSPGAVR